MKGAEGRRNALSGLTDRFSLEAVARRIKQQRDRQTADDLLRMAAQAVQAARPRRREKHVYMGYGVKGGKINRRRAQARKRRGIVRANHSKRVRYLKKQKARLHS